MSEFNNPRITKDGLDFDLWINARKCTFNQSFIKNGFIIRQIDGAKIKIKKSRNTIDIEEYIHENPPQITFINENGAISIVEGNLMVKKKPISIVELPEDKNYPSRLATVWSRYQKGISGNRKNSKYDSICYNSRTG